MYDIILSFLTAFTLTYFAIPSIINIARVKNLTDEPGERRSHQKSTPSLGGIAMFVGLIFSIVFWTPFQVFGDLQYILCAFIIIFLIGAKDDILPVVPYKKILGQILAAVILIYKSNVKISSFFGIFGIHILPDWASLILSVFVILVIVNSFNLIDGINGLSGSIGVLISMTFGTWFFLVDHIEFAIIAFAMSGATVAFLKYNFTPAQIFMGDTGALLLGLVCSILALKFIEINRLIAQNPTQHIDIAQYAFHAIPAVTFGVLILPLFDTLRVFIMRVSKGKSPFIPDRTHIHHLLIDLGMTHMRATSLLVGANIFFIGLVCYFQQLGSFNLLLLLLAIASLLTFILYKINPKTQKEG